MYVRFLLGMSVTSLRSPLKSNPAWQRSLTKLLWSFFGSALLTELTFDWMQQHLKFLLMVNFRLSYHSLPSALPSSEQRNSRAVKRKHDDFNSVLADWVCIYLPSIFTVRIALRYKKLSLIYIVNCLNRGTDLNRLLIPLSQNTKMQN